MRWSRLPPYQQHLVVVAWRTGSQLGPLKSEGYPAQQAGLCIQPSNNYELTREARVARLNTTPSANLHDLSLIICVARLRRPQDLLGLRATMGQSRGGTTLFGIAARGPNRDRKPWCWPLLKLFSATRLSHIDCGPITGRDTGREWALGAAGQGKPE